MGYQRLCARIDLDAIAKNVAGVRERIDAGTKIMAVVKADAYGHGAVPISAFLEDLVDWFAVATAEEAVELRDGGCKKPILILGYVHPEEYAELLRRGIAMTVFCYADAERISAIAKKQEQTAEIHIKIDTGMHRIGYPVTEEAADEIARIFRLPSIRIGGMFSHFYQADAEDKRAALAQRVQFDQMTEWLCARGVEVPLRHLSNSAGIMELDCPYDMVRMGIMLYGIYPSHEMNRTYPLYPAMELFSHVSCVKSIDAGEGVSYGHTYIAKAPMLLATIPVGYADGYPRCLSGVGHVLIRGVRCPIVGRICMDQMMVDVTQLGEVSVGEKVTLLGKDGDEIITADDLGDMAHSFSYEFVTGVGVRVTRVYYKEGRPIFLRNRLRKHQDI